MTNQGPCTTLERVATLLPDPDRERFLLVVARFRNVPQDDEYLQVLEAIGFMTLLWNKVPSEIRRILEAADPVNGTAAGIAKLVRETVSEAIPSQQDLRGIAQTLREHETVLRSHCRSQGTKAVPLRTDSAAILVLVLIVAALLVERFDLFNLF